MARNGCLHEWVGVYCSSQLKHKPFALLSRCSDVERILGLRWVGVLVSCTCGGLGGWVVAGEDKVWLAR
ncbi:hypothetical protein RchiOBHm_Chr2g0109181 [Rosa chinensis]|uniref:Uncharacterized protein n=1 Tax=Rosa chinensis TaxID=74649 RepID=A0A2P6RPD2_ROSCH|nr:hypothetical protein RchiOBHm_Chr2g0109181 [Rosa chinensis]